MNFSSSNHQVLFNRYLFSFNLLYLVQYWEQNLYLINLCSGFSSRVCKARHLCWRV